MATPWKERYERAKRKLLIEPTLSSENAKIFEEFLAWEEYKLQRENDLRELDEPCYKTLYLYTTRLRIVDRWFKHKPWAELTREDIQRVYDDVEDGRILTLSGRPFKNADTYYGRIMKGKPFELAGKAALTKDIIRFTKRRKDIVRFVTQDGFLKLVRVLNHPRHLFLFWLAWDIGENINSLLQLQKRDFTRRLDSDTGEPEYLVNLPEPKLKRTRQSRTEPTLYQETVQYADMVLEGLEDHDLVFSFEYRQALKLMHQAQVRAGVTCMPDQGRVRWKDLRSGMACHLLSVGWQPHEINLRLGHTPNAPTLNAYINYLAVNRRRPKQKVVDSEIERLREELQRSKEREQLMRSRLSRDPAERQIAHDENQTLRDELAATKRHVERLAGMVKEALERMAA